MTMKMVIFCPGSVHSLIPIPAFHCQDVIKSMSKRNGKHDYYDEQILEVEKGCFSQLAFVAFWGMGPAGTTSYRKLASMLAEK